MTIPTTGRDPFRANRERLANKLIDQTVKGAFRIHGTKNRRHKKAVYKSERASYRALLIAVMHTSAKRMDQK